MKKLLALAMCLLLAAMPGALAESFSARTTLAEASVGKLNNIRLAAEAIDGLTVKHGESFSFNAVVGPRTQSRGYRQAMNGRGVTVTGGGVAQAATTLYLALMQAPEEIVIDEMAVYGGRFRDSYVPDGRHAVITDYSAGNDFRFTNNGPNLRIDMWIDGGWLYCGIDFSDGDTASWFDSWRSSDTATPAPQSDGVIYAQVPLTGGSGTLHNATLAAESIYDTTLATGDVFSFNAIVGPRTGQYGYITGVNGRGAKVVGGGVAQVASAVWLAVKDRENIAILEKSTYGWNYSQNYVSSSADAILTDYNDGIDFSFRYTGPGTLTIYTYVDGDSLVCNLVQTL